MSLHLLHPIAESEPSDSAAFQELQKILGNGDVSTVFQPVVSLADATVIGYEALSRGPQGSVLHRPDALFASAAKFNLVWEIEYLCRSKALEKAIDIIPHKMLFINVDPQIINDPRFQKGHTREILSHFQTNAANIIFEITEKTAIEDYPGFCLILDNYTSQGYKIAIDDAGSGYSGMKRLVQTHPQFIKIDMDLIRGIGTDSFKQGLVKALNDFATVSNSKVIAEGIETEEELAALIDIGVHYGQGFFLQKPHPEFLDTLPEAKSIIHAKNKQKRQGLSYSSQTLPIGRITDKIECFPPSTLGYQALEYFNRHLELQAIPIVTNGQIVGLLGKNQFLANLATQYGIVVYMNRPIESLMNRNPLTVGYETPLATVAKAALSRTGDAVYDYILVSLGERYFGIVTLKRLFETISRLELNSAEQGYVLTKAPDCRPRRRIRTTATKH